MRDLATDMTEVAMKVSVSQFPNSTLAPYLLTDMTASTLYEYGDIHIHTYVRNLSKSG